MLRIAIVDDETKDAERLQSLTEAYFAQQQEACRILRYEDGALFLQRYEPHDIVFMDIKMKTLDGLDTARFLRKLGSDSVLIFVTRMAQFAIRGYEVEALDFILKPVDEASVTYVLDRALQRVRARQGVLLPLRVGSETLTVSTNDLYYIEVYNHDLIYHTRMGDYTVRGTLNSVRDKLQANGFLSCHRSYLVNLKYVSSVQEDALTVAGAAVPIARASRKQFMQGFINYVGENA